MSSFDLFNTRHELIRILAGDFYQRRALLSPLRRLQLAYGCLLVLSKFGFRLGGGHAAPSSTRQRLGQSPLTVRVARKLLSFSPREQKTRGR
jgi:hypothetical protein